MVLLLLLLLLAAAAVGSNPDQQQCIARGAKFRSFEVKTPRKSERGPGDLTLCRIYRGKTCCTSSQTNEAVAALGNLALHGEAGGECLELWEALECSICDPRVGTALPEPPLLCKSFCESVFRACSSAFFSMDQTKQVLLPCGSAEIVCAHAKQWTTNSSHFCELAGFRVSSIRESELCFDGTVKLESDSATRPVSKKKQNRRQHMSMSKMTTKKLFNRLVKLLMTDKVLWAVGGLVLTAGTIYFRHRGLRARQRRMALMKTIHEARARQQAALTASAAATTNSLTKKKL